MNISKKNRVQFCNAAEAHLLERGAELKTGNPERKEFALPTSIGSVFVTVINEPSCLHFVAANFVGYEEAAKIKFGHWKQNFISGEDRMDTHDNILAFRAHIDHLIGEL